MADESASTPHPRNLKQRAFTEFKRFIAILLYLWVVFGLLSVHRSLVLSQRHLDYEEHTFAIVNAFVFAKVLLVAEQLHLGKQFENKPLIYPILYKCLIFSAVLIGFHVMESAAVGAWHGNRIADSIPPLFGWSPKGLLAVGFSCFVLLLPFFGFREIARMIGHTEMRTLLFGKKTKK